MKFNQVMPPAASGSDRRQTLNICLLLGIKSGTQQLLNNENM